MRSTRQKRKRPFHTLWFIFEEKKHALKKLYLGWQGAVDSAFRGAMQGIVVHFTICSFFQLGTKRKEWEETV